MPLTSDSHGRAVLIVTDETSFAERASRKLFLQRGVFPVVVLPGPRFKAMANGRFICDTANPQHLQALWEAIERGGLEPDRLIHCRRPSAAATTAERFWDQQADGFLDVLNLTRWLSVHRAPIDSAVLVVCEAAGLPTDRRTLPAAAALAALAPVLEQEVAGLSCTVADVPESFFTSPSADTAIYADWLVDEISAGELPRFVAYRNGQRLERTLEAVDLGQLPSHPGPKPNGVYLITGGLGRIGLRLAKHLAAHDQARLVILSRAKLPERQAWDTVLAAPDTTPRMLEILSALRDIERTGAGLLVEQADVCDETAVSQAVNAAERVFGKLDGVFHLAAELSDGSAIQPLASTTRQGLATQCRPKLLGLLALQKVLKGHDLDFGVMFSSNSVIVGGTGFAAYAAANAAASAAIADGDNPHNPQRWLSVGWDGWGDPSPWNSTPISYDQGFATLRQVLERSRRPEVYVTTRGLRGREARRHEESAPASAPVGTGRPALDTPYAPPRTALESDLVKAWEEALGFTGVGVNDDLFDLGGDSLAAMTILAIVKDEFGAEISLRDFLDCRRTVVGLSQVLVGRLAAARTPAASLADLAQA